MADIGPKTTVAPVLYGLPNAEAAFFSARDAIVRTEQPDAAILYPLRQQSQRILQAAAAGRQKRPEARPDHRAAFAAR
jgi:hypothetical protein